MKYKNYVTDLHLNLHPNQIQLLEKWYEHAKDKIDFFTLAYYPYHMVEYAGGFYGEEEISEELMNEQWQYISNFLAEKNATDNFISFLGFEWQGTGEDGDHNIYFKNDHGAISLAPRYQALVKQYQHEPVMGIPHHLAYSLGNRGKNWRTHNELFSPFVEIYSHHGSSEKDLTNLSMERHIHMGPRVDNTSVISGLQQGYHFGIIASGDNHEVPAMVKNGRAGVWATDYSKDALWDAFEQRRVYGFTDSQITTWIEMDGQPMGTVFSTAKAKIPLKAEVVANSKIERIELYRDGNLHEVKVAQSNTLDYSGKTVQFKLKIECGWGPNTKYFPEITEKHWEGTLTTTGEIVSVEPIYSSFANYHQQNSQSEVSFQAYSQKNAGDHWMRDAAMKNEGFIFEIKADSTSELQLSIDGETYTYSVEELLNAGDLIVYEEEAKRLVKELAQHDDFYRSDSWYHNAYKVKLSQAIPIEQYQGEYDFLIDVIEEEVSYFVKVVQADGQTSWSSPIWVSKKV